MRRQIVGIQVIMDVAVVRDEMITEEG